MPEPVAPSIALVFGAVAPPQTDVVELFVHLGCSKEVSSYEIKLHNHDGKYSPGGASPITVGLDGTISLGRGATCPLLMTLRVEKVSYTSTPTESYVNISGRCWGERLFRRIVTKTYANEKGENIVKNLMDFYAGLSHTRGGTETVENTDTTYTKLEYTDSPLWDILKYVAETADLSGVIGYDFRVAPDGKFEFFPKLSKTNSTAIVENIDNGVKYEKEILRVRNKVTINGIADKSLPANKVDWTESLTPSDGVWASASGFISLFAPGPEGGHCIKLDGYNLYYGAAIFSLNPGHLVNAELYPLLDFQLYLEKAYSGTVNIILFDATDKTATKRITAAPGEWRLNEVGVGSANANLWENIQSGFDWTQIFRIEIVCDFAQSVGNISNACSFYVYKLYFGGRRYSAVAEDATSQAAYGLREYAETDEELWSDNECNLRAQSLLAYLKDSAEHLTLVSTLLDYGSSPILAGDKVHVELPVEGVDSDFRVESAEYRVLDDGRVLEIMLDLGKEPPRIADYLYGLRTFTVNVEKLSRTKLGKRGIPRPTASGGIGSHQNSHTRGDENAIAWSEPLSEHGGWDPIIGWICPSDIGPWNDGPNYVYFRTLSKDGGIAINHIFCPRVDGYGLLGYYNHRWKEVHSKIFYAPAIDGYYRVHALSGGVPEAEPLAELSKDTLKFGPGGATPLDVYLMRVADHEFELKANVLKPLDDNTTELGSATKRFKKIYVADSAFTSDISIDKTNPVLNLKVLSVIKAVFGFDGVNAFLAAQAGDLILSANSGVIRPSADATCDLGSSGSRWSAIHVSGLGNVGWLNVAGFTVITNGRVLQNVTANAAIITSGQFPLGRLPRSTSGYVLEAEGAGSDPMYVNPNGRYSPAAHAHVGSDITSGEISIQQMPRDAAGLILEAQGAGFYPMYVNPNGRYNPTAHNHGGGDITSGTVAEARLPNVYSGQITFQGGIVTNSVNCTNWHLADAVFANDFRLTEAEKLGYGKGVAFLDNKGKVLMVLSESGDLHLAGRVKSLPKQKKGKCVNS